MKRTNSTFLTTVTISDNEKLNFYGTKEEPWFVANEALELLGISKNIRSRALKRLDADEKELISMMTPGGMQGVWLISEPGFYRIALSARNEKARTFQRWVTHEVLPRIRKYGYYKLNNDERKFVAYKEIAESLNTNVNDLDDSYAKMPRYRLEAEARRLKYEAKQEEEKENIIKDYPYSYDEMDALCDYDLEYVKTFIPDGEEDKYYKRISNGEEWYSEKFKREIPKFKAMWCGK